MDYQYVKDFDEMGYGMCIHWGLYSKLNRGEWVQHLKNIPLNEYKKLSENFTATEFDAVKIAKTAKIVGMKFIIFTTRHHDGFSLYDTKGLNDYDVMHSPVGRDLVKEFVEACRDYGILPILYHTTMDWSWRDKKTWDLSTDEIEPYLEYLRNSVELLCTNYGKIGGLIFDGDWCRSDIDWKHDELYGMIRKHQPEALIINNTGLENPGELTASEIDVVTFEQNKVEKVEIDSNRPIATMRWQTLNKHWGSASRDLDFKSIKTCLYDMLDSRKKGAVHVHNIGPDGNGSFNYYDFAVMEAMGCWLHHYGEGFYGCKAGDFKCPGEDFYLEKDQYGYYYCHDLGIGSDGELTIFDGSVKNCVLENVNRKIKSIKWLCNDESLEFDQNLDNQTLTITATPYSYGTDMLVRVAKIEFE